MTNAVPNQTSADILAAIIAAGVARYQASLPDYTQDFSADDIEPPQFNVSAVDEALQIQLCLSCPLADCVGVESSACPIRIEARRVWRKR